MTDAKTVLFGWELGGGLAHASNLLRIADSLVAEGHHTVFAVREAVVAWPLLRSAPGPVVPAPTCSDPIPRDFVAASFADILGSHGYASERTLLPLLRQWEGLLDVVGPDLVVVDYAPTLALAAAGRIPTIDVGCGFCQPPAHSAAYPRFQPNTTAPLRFEERDLLAVLRTVQAARGRPAPDAFPAITAGAESYVTTYPELDPYRLERRSALVGPIDPPVPFGSDAPRRFYAYLTAEVNSTEPALGLLTRAGFEGEAYVRGATADQRARLRALGLTVHESPPPLAEVLPQVRAVIHQGGLNTCQAALTAGRPQLMLPAHLEHQLNASACHRLGVAHYLSGTYPAADLLEGVRQLLGEARFARRAAEVAGHLHRRWPVGALGVITDRCRALLGGASGG